MGALKLPNKTIYKALVLLLFLICNGIVIYSASSILSYFKTGADRASMIHLALKSKDNYLPKMQWQSLENPGRPMEKQTLKELEKHYLSAWYVKQLAYQSQDIKGVKDFYTDSARVNIYKQVERNKKEDIRVNATTLSHMPSIDFYSADGQLIVLHDKQVVTYQEIFKKDTLITTAIDSASYKVILLLEDGFWRIRHMVRDTVLSKTPQIKELKHTKNKQLLVNKTPFFIKGINYYPQQTPWDMFGERFDSTPMEKDFTILKNAGLNTVRIFVPYASFGKAEIIPEKLKKLQNVLDNAEKKDIKVILTLFDFYGDYSVLNWSLTHRHSQALVSALKPYKAIIAWDIKNEPDLDFVTRKKHRVLAWLSSQIALVKQLDPTRPVTIGWSSFDAAKNLVEQVDFISAHYYLPLTDFEKELKNLEKNSLEKPIVVQEFGYSSNQGIWNPFSGTQQKQAMYHKKIQELLKKHHLPFVSWTLYDFTHVPKDVVGRLPWRKNKQKHFGFIDKNGKTKKAFKYIK